MSRASPGTRSTSPTRSSTFRHEQREKRRIHQKPELRHVVACRPWLDAELEAVATTHPSAVLRLRGRGGFDEAFGALVADLRLVASHA